MDYDTTSEWHHITSLLLCTGLQPLSDESSPELQLLSLYLPAVCLLKEQTIWLIKISLNSNIQKVEMVHVFKFDTTSYKISDQSLISSGVVKNFIFGGKWIFVVRIKIFLRLVLNMRKSTCNFRSMSPWSNRNINLKQCIKIIKPYLYENWFAWKITVESLYFVMA